MFHDTDGQNKEGNSALCFHPPYLAKQFARHQNTYIEWVLGTCFTALKSFKGATLSKATHEHTHVHTKKKKKSRVGRCACSNFTVPTRGPGSPHSPVWHAHVCSGRCTHAISPEVWLWRLLTDIHTMSQRRTGTKKKRHPPDPLHVSRSLSGWGSLLTLARFGLSWPGNTDDHTPITFFLYLHNFERMTSELSNRKRMSYLYLSEGK